MDKSDFFFCYDYYMQKYLSEKNHQFVTHARSIRNGREFWLFVRSDELQVSIDEFKEKKKYAQTGIE